MFNELKKIIRNTKALKVDAIFVRIVKESEVKKLIIKLNKIEQLFKQGIDAEGDVIGEYSAYTEFVNKGRTFSIEGTSRTKKAGNPIILYDSGDFYRSFKVKVYKDGFTITSNDDINGTILSQKFGEKIMGLTDESIGTLTQEIKPKFILEVKKAILK